jgi:bifunctional DNA-binding transcriptional regulator/antitoxin component of YhaV-PrlF toxin-antitoxin module
MTSFSTSVMVNDGGEIVLPREIIEAMGLNVGDELIFQVTAEEVRLTTRAELVKRLRGVFQATGRDLTQELLEERHEEALRKWSSI